MTNRERLMEAAEWHAQKAKERRLVERMAKLTAQAEGKTAAPIGALLESEAHDLASRILRQVAEAETAAIFRCSDPKSHRDSCAEERVELIVRPRIEEEKRDG